MYGFSIGALGSALIIAGLTYFGGESLQVVRAIMFIWAGINVFIFAASRK